MKIQPIRGWARAAVTGLVLALAGCGDRDDPKEGGSLKVLAGADFQHIDPGQANYQFDYMAVSATQRPLYWWKPDDIQEPVPDLAVDDPEVSADGKTVTIRIRKGVRFSPPVNRDVISEDVKYAIERGALSSVANPYAGTYFGSLVGFKEFQAKKAKQISGIQTPDDHTIVFKLTTPGGVIGTAPALTMPLTAPVPKEYAEKFDQKTQSTYGQHEVATGPYMFQNNSSGKVTGYEPGKRAVLVRNPNWNKSTDYRPAYLDRIEFALGNDVNVASRKILAGQNQVSGDFVVPPSIAKEALRSRKEQIAFIPSVSTSYMAINTTLPPLDDVNVRKAILAGMDRDALRLIQGGVVSGDIATHFIPPGVPGFQEAGGFSGKFDFLKSPKGDAALAASYLKKAGYESGKYDGNTRLLMVGVNQAPADKMAEAAAAQLEKLGFKVDLRNVPTDTMYTKFCNVPKAEVAFCPSVGWRGDFNDAQTFLEGPFHGKNIFPVNNFNWPQLNDSKVNAAMDQGAKLTNPSERVEAWARVDQMVTALAPALPWVWPKFSVLRSSNVDGVVNRFVVMWDLSFTGLK